MSLRHALLGFLTTEPASGYRLSQEFGESAGSFWYASHSQIHPELKRLEQAGLVESRAETGDSRGTKLYSITTDGRAELDRWLEQGTDYAPMRDVERVRLLFLDQQPLEVIRKHFETHLDHHQRLLETYTAQLEQVERGTFPRLVKRLASQPEPTHPLVVGLKVLALRGNAERARREIDWARSALQWLDGQSGPTPADRAR
jgi:DNA-binding PadR family transcriptional regulator